MEEPHLTSGRFIRGERSSPIYLGEGKEMVDWVSIFVSVFIFALGGIVCVDHVFWLKEVCENNWKGKDLYMVCKCLDKAYDLIDRNVVWQILLVYGMNGHLVRVVQKFYQES